VPQLRDTYTAVYQGVRDSVAEGATAGALQ